MVTTTKVRDGHVKKHTLGSLRLRHHESNQIILIPTPTNDPNDPLNWSKTYRYYIAVLVCAAIFFCNFLAAGPTVAIVDVTTTFFGPPGPTDPNFSHSISRVAYFFTTTALMQGMGTLFWMPIVIKYGRRPVYVISFMLYTACAGWAGGATSYGSELASRIIMGFAAGAAEVLAPLTISDIFFLHERGTVMAIYTCALSAGVGGGIIISGLITINHGWRTIYWVSLALIAACTVLVVLAFPETIYKRSEAEQGEDPDLKPITPLNKPYAEHHEHGDEKEKAASDGTPMEKDIEATAKPSSPSEAEMPAKRTYLQSLRLFSGTYTEEPFWQLFIRPIVLLTLPPVFWATLVMSGTIGFLVAITSNFAPAFENAYNFKPWQAGLCFIGSLIGSFSGIAVGGHFSDWIADVLTRKNGGIREPEMRLPAIAVSVITAPLALVLYGVGINNHLHWICPTFGLLLINFSIVQATNVSLVYTIDSYRPVAGEIVVTQMAFKSAFGFLLSFYTNPWVDEAGYSHAYGAMAGISGGLLVLGTIFFFFGKSIRRYTWHWGYVRRLAHWSDDREVGE